MQLTKPSYLQTKIFLDSGNPADTRQALELLGFLDGQTTNPSLVAKNPTIVDEKNQGILTEQTIWDEYKKVALAIRDVIPQGAISVEVYADKDTSFEDMLAKAHELANWFPGIYVKLPVTYNGLKTANILVSEGINVNMTLCFSQDQAAAVHMATKGAKRGQVFVSPFIGRLDDIGFHGLDLIKNIMLMYQTWNSHVMVLGASIRGLDHFYGCIQAGTDIITVPLAVLQTWASSDITMDPSSHIFEIAESKAIPYEDLSEGDWMLYNLKHVLTDKGIEKFASDWKSLFSK